MIRPVLIFRGFGRYCPRARGSRNSLLFNEETKATLFIKSSAVSRKEKLIFVQMIVFHKRNKIVSLITRRRNRRRVILVASSFLTGYTKM